MRIQTEEKLFEVGEEKGVQRNDRNGNKLHCLSAFASGIRITNALERVGDDE